MNFPAVAGKLPVMAKSLIDRIDERLRFLGLSERAGALKAGLDAGAIRDLRRRGSRASMRGDTLTKLASALETSVAWLSGEADTAQQVSASAPAQAPDLGTPIRAADVPLPARHQMTEDVPVLGTALGSVVHHVEGFHFEGGQIDTVRRPPALVGAKDLYAVYVEGDSMEPAHPAGALRFVHPHRPCQIGDTVIVMTRTHNDDPGQAYIKVLRKRALGSLFLEQYNP